MVLAHNIEAINSSRMLGITWKHNIVLSEKLSSGFRINRSADDASGLAISEKMRRQIRGLTQAAANAQDGISVVQSAEGALHEVHDMLQRMNQLAIHASNGTNSDQDRSYLQQEVAQLITEIDRVATTTKFNEQPLMDGRFAKETAGGKQTNPKIIIHDMVYDITTRVNPQYRVDPATQPAKWDTLKATLKDEMVPQAVTNLLNTFSKTFGYMTGANIGVGLMLTDNPYSTTMASVSMRTAYIAGSPAKVDIGYTLTVNAGRLPFDAANNYELTDQGRRDLESIIVHEMMHGLMMESLSSGMAGVDQDMSYVKGFPTWFIEGTAQAAGGGAQDVTTWLGLDTGSTENEIGAALRTDALGSGTTESLYGTGYLAAMYLGYLASGGNSLSAGSIASGLDHLMFEIRGGKSLSQVIAENTNGQYTGLSDFETRFAQDGIAFTQQLLGAAGNGYGAVVGGLTSENLLGDNAVTQPVFALNPDYEEVWNEYKDGYDIIEGGRADVAGTAGAGHPNYNANAGTGGTGGNAGTGGTGGNTGTGGIGGNTGTGGTGGNTGTGGGTGGTTPGTGSTPGTGGTNPGGGQSGGIPTPAGGGISLQVGAEPGQKITVYIEAMDAAAIGVDQVNISTAQGANQAIDFIKEAITKVSSQRSHLGACQNRLEHTINNLENVIENTTAAESQIRDVDMARLMVEYSNNRILLQAGQAMLSQSNSSREFLLALFS